MSYGLMYASGPTEQTFLPFSDSVAIQFANESICGPRTYTIVEGYTFLQLVPPAIGNEFFDPWTLTLESSNLLEIGSYETTMSVTLTNYPTSTPAVVTFTTSILNPCFGTTLTIFRLLPMTFMVGSIAPVS